MNSQDLKDFTALMSSTWELFNREITPSQIGLLFKTLKHYPLDDIEKGVEYCLKTSQFCPTIKNIIAGIQTIHGVDESSLKVKSNVFWNSLNRHFDLGADIICDDPLAVYAFKACFGSLEQYANHDFKSEPFDHNRFEETYLNLRPEYLSQDIRERYVIAGIYHTGKFPNMKFIGDKDFCMKIAKQIYRKDQIPRFPREQRSLIAYQPSLPPLDDKTEKEIKQMLDETAPDKMLEKVMSLLMPTKRLKDI